ncbi:MAG: glycoside hydrolase family 29 [Chitinophagaceae bacterium]|nr:MAG: glycoside hydrolase family 29 [Chitinophagaceae bacterium]
MKIDRRQFLKSSALSGMAVTIGSNLFANTPTIYYKKTGIAFPVPTFPQMEWQDSEIGIIFHFDISVAVNRHNEPNNDYREVFDPTLYNPIKLDTDQWIQTAKAAGATYAVFTATHFCGFMQWQSDLYPYGLKQAKWKNGKGDIVADFVKSCYKYDIRPGLYLSTNNNAYWQTHNHYVDWGKGKGTRKQKEFNHVCEKMVEELCSHYGGLLEIWFDAGNMTPAEDGPDVLPIFEKYQPNGLFYSSLRRSDFRWVGNEQGYADYPCWATMPSGAYSHSSEKWKPFLGNGDPNGSIWSPAMVDAPLRGSNGVHSWFWRPGQEKGLDSLQRLTTMYEQSVGRNSGLILGVVIDSDGLVPEVDKQRLIEFGDALKYQYNHPIGSIKGKGNSFRFDLKTPVSLKRYVLQEDIQFGERVRSYMVKGKSVNGNWIKIGKGSCIGHKRIAPIDSSERFSQVTLQILESTDVPYIRDFIVF